MSNHGDIARGVDFKDACAACGGTMETGTCMLCGRELPEKDDKEEDKK